MLHGVFSVNGKTITMEKLAEESSNIISRYYQRGIKDIEVRLFVCIRGKYLYFSRFHVLGVNKLTNKWEKLSQGVDPIVRYAVAVWKYQHARSKEIEWNVIRFDFDGYDADIGDTKFDSEILKKAQSDAKDGIITRSARSLMQFINRATIGSSKPEVKKDKDSSDNDIV